VRERAGKPAEQTAASLRGAIMDGRLAVMRLADAEATAALVAGNLPAAFECLDLLETQRATVMKRIEGQSGPRTREDGMRDEKYLDLTARMSDLQGALNDITQVPAGLEPFLAQLAARTSAGRLAAIGLIGRLDISEGRRRAILQRYVSPDDRDAAEAARRALTEMETRARPARSVR